MTDLQTDFSAHAPASGLADTPGLVAWTPELSVHSPTLDMHHQILVGCLNRMLLLKDNWNESLPAVRRELALIRNYCKIHFFVEEEAMKRAHVPEQTLSDHKTTHRRILAKMDDSIKSFAASPLTFPFVDILKFLNMWLVRHIQDEDKRHYGDALRAHRAIEPDLARFRYSEISRKLSIKEDPNRSASANDTLSGRSVSIIESNMERRTTLIRTLQDQGMKISHAKSIDDAPALIDTNAPEVLFLDWTVPNADHFARELYRKRNTLVIATWFGDPMEIIDTCDTLGVSNILAYPCSAKDIVSTARETLDAFVPLRAMVLERLRVEP